MKKIVLLFVAGFIFLQSHAEPVITKADTSIPRILILNAFNASEIKARKNKKELFAELADSLKHYLRNEIRGNTEFEIVVSEGLVNDTAGHILNGLLQKHNCTSAIIISKLNVYFEQNGVEVTKNSDGSKTREAFYDICSDVRYLYYVNNATPEVLDRKNCKFFTKRSVASGMLAAGPDIVGKSKYAFIAIRLNAVMGADEMIYLLRKEANQ